jgi:hypothetical protein
MLHAWCSAMTSPTHATVPANERAGLRNGSARYLAPTACRLLCIFGSGGEHLHTLRAGGDGDGASPPLRHATWLDGESVAAACGPDALVWRVDGEAAEAAGAFATNPAAGIERLALSPDGRYLAAGCANRTERRAGGVDRAMRRQARRPLGPHAVTPA